jgi:hypothetical protein
MTQIMSEFSVTNNPAIQALQFYQQKFGDEAGEEMFYNILDLHLLYGYVSATPEYFYMGRPVNKSASYEDLLDISKTYSPDKQNCWCIYFVSGNMEAAWNNLPFYLPYCTFEHKGILKFYVLEKLKQRISKYYGFRRNDRQSGTSGDGKGG